MKKLYLIMLTALSISSYTGIIEALAIFNSTTLPMSVTLNDTVRAISESKTILPNTTYLCKYKFADSSTQVSQVSYSLTASYTDTANKPHSKSYSAPKELNAKNVPALPGSQGNSSTKWAYIISLDKNKNPQILNYTFKVPTP
jgi:hypothetical protein